MKPWRWSQKDIQHYINEITHRLEATMGAHPADLAAYKALVKAEADRLMGNHPEWSRDEYVAALERLGIKVEHVYTPYVRTLEVGTAIRIFYKEGGAMMTEAVALKRAENTWVTTGALTTLSDDYIGMIWGRCRSMA